MSTHTTWYALHQGHRPSWPTCSPRLFGTVERGSSMSWIKPPIWSQNAQLGSYLNSKLASPWPLHFVVLEKQSCHKLCVAWHCPGQTQNFFRKRPSPTESYYMEKPDVTLELEDSIQPHQFTSPTMVVGTSYHDWWAMVTIRGMGACIYLSLLLPAMHTSKTISVKQRERRLITKDTVPPEPDVSSDVRSTTHTWASPVIQSQSNTPGGTPGPITTGQQLVYHAPNRQHPLKRRIISTCRWIRSQVLWIDRVMNIICE